MMKISSKTLFVTVFEGYSQLEITETIYLIDRVTLSKVDKDFL